MHTLTYQCSVAGCSDRNDNPDAGADDPGWGEHVVAARWTICQHCDGEGHHGNPAFDGMSLRTMHEEWDWEERDDYFSGRWDVRCTECGGSGKTLEPADDAARAHWEQSCHIDWRHREEDRKTYLMESGLYGRDY